MIISFFGHRTFNLAYACDKFFIEQLNQMCNSEHVEFYFGGYGNFDMFAYDCCKHYRDKHPACKFVFVTPYISESYQKNRLEFIKKDYDEILFPQLKKTPPKYAIIKRNEIMINSSDFVFFYIAHSWGGAYRAYQYAKSKKKPYINLFDVIYESENK